MGKALDDDTSPYIRRVSEYSIQIIAIVVFGTGLLRVTQALPDRETLYYFLTSALLALIPLLNKIVIKGGDIQIELDKLKERTELQRLEVKSLDSAVRYGTYPEHQPKLEIKDPLPGEHEDDPWKGVFGGKVENNGRRITASVKAIRGDKGWFTVDINVAALKGFEKLKGEVKFYLHDTFKQDKPVVEVNERGEANLTLRSFGAFTVGAIADNGRTFLELDLSELEDAPRRFTEA